MVRMKFVTAPVIDIHSSLKSPDPDDVIPAAVYAKGGVGTEAVGETGIMLYEVKPFPEWIIKVDSSAIGADPNYMILVLADRFDVIAIDRSGTLLQAEIAESGFSGIQDGEPVVERSDPYFPVCIFEQCIDVVAGQGTPDIMIMPEGKETGCSFFETANSRIVGTDP